MAKKTVVKREIEVEVRPYELMLILNPELRESEVKKKLKEITDMIEKVGGKITNEDFWGKKDLAYQIKKNWAGIYVVYSLELPNIFLKELKEYLRIEKEVLRSMILTLPANHTYTKYDLETHEEEPGRKKEKNFKRSYEKAVASPKKEEVKEEKVEEKEESKEEETEEKEEEKEDEKGEDSEAMSEEEKKRESELDKKLDEILGGEDLNL